MKKLEKLKELPDNSHDIESDNMIKRYQRRPRQLENLCLAEFVECFDCVKEKDDDKNCYSCEATVTFPGDFIPETNFEDNTDDDPSINISEPQCELKEYQLKGGMTLRKRKKPGIITSVRYHKDNDKENYFREQLMLYIPW